MESTDKTVCVMVGLLFAFLWAFFAAMVVSEYAAKNQALQCIGMLKDKPAIEINLVCGVKK